MVIYTTGNIFDCVTQVITNPINIMGSMKYGLASEFKKRYPEMYKDYRRRYKEGTLKIGEPYLWCGERVDILNFPTKKHWHEPSKLEYIERGLQYIADNYQMLGFVTIAMPLFGCGSGELDPTVVKNLIEEYLEDFSDLYVILYDNSERSVK